MTSLSSGLPTYYTDTIRHKLIKLLFSGTEAGESSVLGVMCRSELLILDFIRNLLYAPKKIL